MSTRAQQIREFMRAGGECGASDLELVADRLARTWREDCYLYAQPGYVVMSQGPDLDHPKREPVYVARYIAPARRASA